MLGKDWRQEKGMTGWDSWMASPTQWTWVRASPRSWWRTGKPGTLHFMGSQSQMQLSDWTELNSHQHCNSRLNEAPLTHTSSGRHSQPSGCGTLYSTILEDHFSQWNSPTKRMKMWKMWHQTDTEGRFQSVTCPTSVGNTTWTTPIFLPPGHVNK